MARPRIDSIEVNTQDEIEGMDVQAIVCARVAEGGVLIMPDNLVGKCRDCGAAIQFRPHAPPGPRICYECFVVLSNKDEGEEISIHVSEKAVAEVVEYFKKKDEH